MNNYPSEVNENTFGAPWNVIDIEKEVEITVRCLVSTTISGPRNLTKDTEEDLIYDITKDKIKCISVIDGLDLLEIKNINVL